MSILRAVLGIPGLTYTDLKNETYRKRFSEYLPWIAFDRQTKAYLCADNTAGFIFECSPLAFAGEKTADTLEGILRLNLPDGSVLQFILVADDHIDPYVTTYRSLKTRDDPLVRKGVERFGAFLLSGTEGLQKLNTVPVRDFRLIVALKFPLKEHDADMHELRSAVAEILGGARLFPTLMEPEELLAWMRRFFNGSSNGSGQYNDNIPLNRQIILAETPIEKTIKEMRIGDRYFRCTTPRTVPREVDLSQTNLLFGGIWGVHQDINQYRTPFLYCLSILFTNLRTKLHAKCNAILQQKGVGSFARQHQARQEEHEWAVGELEKGRRFLRIVPILWVFGRDEKAVGESLVRAKRLWEDSGYVMQEDRGILPILFISSLPLGLYHAGSNVDNLERDFIAPTDTIATLLPTQGDFAGGGRPELLLVGRKGQVCGLDIFDRGANNHNIFVAAQTGAGKSFFINYLVHSYYGADAKIRIIDIGDSYKKATVLYKARYLDFGEERISINPFSRIIDPEYDLPVIAQIAAQMAYSTSEKAAPTDTETQLLANAVTWAYESEGEDAEIDHVYRYLKAYPDDAKEGVNGGFSDELSATAHRLAFTMREFARGGKYEAFFNGRSPFNIRDDEFVVLELGKLEQQRSLFNVAVLQVINAVTNDFYRSDRSEKKLVIFDEAWQFLRDSPIIQKVIEDGYRKARKHSGSFTVVTQSINDLELFGRVGKVIYSSSAFKFYLQADDIEKAKNAGIIDYGDFEIALLKSVRQNRPKYSEIFMDTPFGSGVARLVVDPFSYWIYTSAPDDNKLIETIMAEKSPTYEGAIEEILKREGSGRT
ncbi:MAG: TraC family protein [Syntrophorhabdales bacterium]